MEMFVWTSVFKEERWMPFKRFSGIHKKQGKELYLLGRKGKQSQVMGMVRFSCLPASKARCLLRRESASWLFFQPISDCRTVVLNETLLAVGDSWRPLDKNFQ